jgi:thymidylate kinase
MDGPKINAVDGLLYKIGLLEQSFYLNSSAPDLVLRLELSVEEAKLRNRNRDKFGKETDAEIEMRFELFSDYVPKALSCVTIDSSKSIEEVQSLAVSEISALLSKVIVK